VERQSVDAGAEDARIEEARVAGKPANKALTARYMSLGRWCWPRPAELGK
jgi:hypothetical protein